jgi:hypothetical protein
MKGIMFKNVGYIDAGRVRRQLKAKMLDGGGCCIVAVCLK